MVSNLPGVRESVLTSQRQLNKNGAALGKSLERLATGFKINKAADDAAGFAAAQQLLSVSRGTQAAFDAVQTAANVGNIADGAIDTITNNVQRIRELGITAASDTTGADGRAAIQAEIDQLIQQNDQIAQTTQFNGRNLLDGSSSGSGSLSVPTDENATAVQLDISDARSAALGLTSPSVATSAGARALIDQADTALQNLADSRAGIGATLNRFDSVSNNLSNSLVNNQAALSRIRDTDYAAEASNFIKASLLQRTGVSVLAQSSKLGSDLTKLIS